MTAKELREKRAPLVKRTGEMRDKANKEDRVFTDEEQTNWEKLHKDYEELTLRIDQAELQEKREAEQLEVPDDTDVGKDNFDGRDEVRPNGSGRKDAGRHDPTDEDRALCLQGWMCTQQDVDVRAEHVEAADRCGIKLARRNFDVQMRSDIRRVKQEHRALSALTGSAGAATIPEGFIPNLELALLTFGGMRAVSDIMRTTEGNDLPWPTSNDTSNTGALIAENKTVTEQDVAFEALVLHAYKYTSKLIKVPSELLTDSAFNLANVLGEMLGERLGRIGNTHFTTGDGAAKPTGIVTGATLGVTAAAVNAFTYDEVINLFHSVGRAYRPNGSWMFHDNVLLALKKLKDGNGNYLWRSGDLSKGVPDTIENKPYTINDDMSSTITTTDKTILFGDLSKYKIREVGSIRLRRLVERFADADQEGFVAFMRFDGALLDAGTNPVKYLQQA